MSWTEHAAERSPMMQRWRERNVQQMKIMVAAARRLIATKGPGFTARELAKEAGVANQTFYRHFGGKDQLLLATIEDIVTEQVLRYEEEARELPDPVSRLHHYVTAVVKGLDERGPDGFGPRFITTEHWRLHQLDPEGMARADQPFVDLVARELQAAKDQGLLDPPDVQRAAELVDKLVMAVFHHYAFASRGYTAEEIAEHTWQFCLAGMRGDGQPDADENTD